MGLDSSNTLTVLGGLLATYIGLRVVDFLCFYVLRVPSLNRYKHGAHNENVNAQPWALVTGSSDGIGRGFAEELCSRGFNIILHGRNGDKLAGVRKELLQQWPNAHVRLAVLDAIDFTNDTMNAMVKELAGLNITVLVNNVGGYPPVKTIFRSFLNVQQEEIDGAISMNARFPTNLTAKLFPQLLRGGPSLIINVGSLAAVSQVPYLSVYSGAKAFNHAWGQSLHYETVAEAQHVEVLTLMVGNVQNQWDSSPATLFRPTARQFAKSSLHKVGCGRGLITPYPGHALQVACLLALPGPMKKSTMIQMAKGLQQKEAEKAEKTK